MTAPFPTKTRLALLQAVDDGEVIEGLTDDTIGETWWTDEVDPPRKVTARINELEHAGWVELGQEGAFWRLTPAGRSVLEAGRGGGG